MESYLIIIMEYCHARLPEAHTYQLNKISDNGLLFYQIKNAKLKVS